MILTFAKQYKKKDDDNLTICIDKRRPFRAKINLSINPLRDYKVMTSLASTEKCPKDSYQSRVPCVKIC